jgi:hypothetical protein
MNRALVKSSRVKPPAGLVKLFADPPLVGNETREGYDGLFNAIAVAVKPADAIAWLFVRDITDLSWEIRRERNLKLQVIKSAHEDKVRVFLTPPRPFTGELVMFDIVPSAEENANSEKIAKQVKQWSTDPKARRRIDKELAERGYDAEYILTKASNEVADCIDAIDRRLAAYELRRMAALRAIEHYNETLARRLEAVYSEVIEGQFTEAPE